MSSRIKALQRKQEEFKKTTQNCPKSLKTYHVGPFREELREPVTSVGHTFIIIPVFDDGPV